MKFKTRHIKAIIVSAVAVCAVFLLALKLKDSNFLGTAGLIWEYNKPDIGRNGANNSSSGNNSYPDGAWLNAAAISKMRAEDALNADGITIDIPEKIYPRGLNIVFVSDYFTSFEEFKAATDKIIASMKTVESWKSYKDFNFFLIFDSRSRSCEVNEDEYLTPKLKCSTELISIIRRLPLVKLKIAVISRRNFVSWANLTRFDNSFIFYNLPKDKEDDTFQKKIFLHEFAHGFGLRDETSSVVAQAGSAPTLPGGPNCAPTVGIAKKWWGGYLTQSGNTIMFDSTKNEVGFYFGCAGNRDYFRPTQKSFMNIQDFPDADSYGPVSEAYLKKVLDYCFSEKRYKESDDPEFFTMYPEFKECLK